MSNENEIKNEVISDAALDEVSGGHDPFGGVPTNGGYGERRIRLTGPYYVDSFGSGKPYTAYVGAPNLFVVCKYPNRGAGYAVLSAGVIIGWAPRSSFEYLDY